jgi:predicted GIY-YIG superfamily endonuclease
MSVKGDQAGGSESDAVAGGEKPPVPWSNYYQKQLWGRRNEAWKLYFLTDGSSQLYVGITSNTDRRLAEHQAGESFKSSEALDCVANAYYLAIIDCSCLVSAMILEHYLHRQSQKTLRWLAQNPKHWQAYKAAAHKKVRKDAFMLKLLDDRRLYLQTHKLHRPPGVRPQGAGLPSGQGACGEGVGNAGPAHYDLEPAPEWHEPDMPRCHGPQDGD